MLFGRCARGLERRRRRASGLPAAAQIQSSAPTGRGRRIAVLLLVVVEKEQQEHRDERRNAMPYSAKSWPASSAINFFTTAVIMEKRTDWAGRTRIKRERQAARTRAPHAGTLGGTCRRI